GVDVRLLLPSKADHLLVWLASFSYVTDIAWAGVKVFRYNEGFMHQKVLVMDDEVAMVGTANLDNRSFRLNFETNVIVADREFTSRLAGVLERDFQASKRDERVGSDLPFWQRFGSYFARLFAPIL